jgi:predicted ATPase/DNA-binding CsgD family transcriptional regulator
VASAEGVHGFVPALTSFVGRASEVDEVAGLLGQYRLVTVTGPGGVGKTRLACEVARRVAGRFADGVWLVELAAVQDAALVPAAVAVALAVRQPPGLSIVQALAGVLAGRQLLLVLDNCEHVLGAVAELCGGLLPAADDVRVLATSRERLGIAGEARYRLKPLALPGPDHLGEAGGSEAVALFADRARQADAHFDLGGEAGSAVARLVARLDGMPLAIELAAARVESLGVAPLLDRLDDRFALLASGDRLAAPRQRSLAATVDWSYQLLGEDEREVFRRLAVFPGSFTLEAAEAVAGAAAGPAVLHLVDCSLLTPPRTGPDGRARYLMLETLRAYGLGRLAEAGEQHEASAALAGYALQAAEQAAAGMQASGSELAAARWLDAEDTTTQQALDWALEHDPSTALRLAMALPSWWRLRGRTVAGYALLRAAASHTVRGEDEWSGAQLSLGYTATFNGDCEAGVGHFTAVLDAVADRGPSQILADGLAGRSWALLMAGQVPGGTEDARHALTVARELGYPAGEAMALIGLNLAGYGVGDIDKALEWAREAHQVDPAAMPDWILRRCDLVTAAALLDAGQLDAAERMCAGALAQAREVGDLQDQADFLWHMAELDRRAGRIAKAGMRLGESLRLAVQTGDRLRRIDCLDTCGHLCAATGRWSDAITLWAAYAAQNVHAGLGELPQDALRRQEPLQQARQELGPERRKTADDRGAAMTLETAVEFAAMLTAQDPQTPQQPQGLAQLSARERELVTLVAQGRTDAQIAGQLYISVTTVRSHLERIRDKTGSRRRADLTRLALQAGLV